MAINCIGDRASLNGTFKTVVTACFGSSVPASLGA